MDKLLSAINTPSPLHSFRFLSHPEREILIKRDDLIHPQISGNKWRKLKYNIDHALKNECKGILSFGGAFSNHLYATAAACKLSGLRFKAVIRSSQIDELNPTLKFLLAQGAEVSYLNNSSYRKSLNASGLEKFQSEFPDFHVIPEGGSNQFAFKGVMEIVEEVYQEVGDAKLVFICGVGSGATITGIVKALKPGNRTIGMLAVNDSSLEEKIRSELTADANLKLTIDKAAHMGGFAKVNKALIDFVNSFFTATRIPIDPIYNGKVLYRLEQMLSEGLISPDHKIVVIHTGGLQGNNGFNYRFPERLVSDLVGL